MFDLLLFDLSFSIEIYRNVLLLLYVLHLLYSFFINFQYFHIKLPALFIILYNLLSILYSLNDLAPIYFIFDKVTLLLFFFYCICNLHKFCHNHTWRRVGICIGLNKFCKYRIKHNRSNSCCKPIII